MPLVGQRWMVRRGVAPALLMVFAILAVAQDGETVARTMAVTIDDLPFGGPQLTHQGSELEWLRQRTDLILRHLKKHEVPAIGFVNESKLLVQGEIDARVDLLAKWLDAGMALGNHTFSHPSLTRTDLGDYQADVLHGEVLTKWLLKRYGKDIVYFRYPFNHRGPTKAIRDEFQAFLEQRGYKAAPFTVEHSDYLFNVAYVKAKNQKDAGKVRKIGNAYLRHLEVMTDFFETISNRLFKRNIPQILLIHTNEINADYLDEMLIRLSKRGYRFVSLDQALEDPAYRTPDGFAGKFGPSWLHRFSMSLGVAPVVRNGRSFPAYLLEEPDPPEFIRASQ